MDERRYPFFAYQFETDTGPEWCVEFIDVSGVVGGGVDLDEAVDEAYDNLKAHLEFLQEDGIELPVPTVLDEQKYSGKMPFRTSKSIHQKLSILAKKEGVSINHYINEAVIEKITRERQSL